MDFFRSPGKNNPFARASSQSHEQAQDDAYSPPPGPPPHREHANYIAPPGPPPSHEKSGYGAQSSSIGSDAYLPPPGPPPAPLESSNEDQPPPYHDWQSVPDTAGLPPPPALKNDYSLTSNADEADAERARLWCKSYPLMKPHQPTASQISAVRTGTITLQKPAGRVSSISGLGTGRWNVSTSTDSPDSCFISSLPLYFVSTDSPLHTERTKTTYYEIKIKSLRPQRDGTESSAALGFCAVPYPTFRMPGWERGSFAVHSDDGHRYVNDNEGGKDFTTPIRAGETVGLGVTYSIQETSNQQYPGVGLKGEVFFTRNGQKAGSWNIHEELDEEDRLGVFGIDGTYDLFAAVGIFGRVSLDVLFNSRDWLWMP